MRIHDRLSSAVAHAAGVLVIACVSLLPRVAAAQPIDVVSLNERYIYLDESRRSDLIVLPLLADMAEPPAILLDDENRALVAPGSPNWPEVEAWVTAPEQQKILEALEVVTRERDYRRGMRFAQPYGAEGIPIPLIRAGLYTELGDPPLLSAAQHGYLDEFNDLIVLAHVEATRLSAEGEIADACEALIHLVLFARQVADRSFYREVEWAMRAMADGMRRIRDVVYVDFWTDRALSPSDIRGLIDPLSSEPRFLSIDRIRLPDAEIIAARQLISRVYNERANINETSFATTMAGLGSVEQPLRLFSESARWRQLQTQQVDWFEINARLDVVAADWDRRWELRPFDPLLRRADEYSKLDPARHAVLTEALPDLDRFRRLRKLVRVEAVGTRQSLGVVGYFYTFGTYPPDISSIRPAWVPEMEADAYDIRREVGRVPPMKFIDPVQESTRGNPRFAREAVHDLKVFTRAGDAFDFRVLDGQFVLYSTGPDGGDDDAARVSESIDATTGDHLIWPPVFSLYRIHLEQNGRLP